MNKTCTKCGETFPATREFFYGNKGHSDGLRSWCKECHNEQNREKYQNDAEFRAKQKERTRERRKNPEFRAKENERTRDRMCELRKNSEFRAKENERKRDWRKNQLANNPEEFRRKKAAAAARRRAIKLNQTPDLTQNEKAKIELLYQVSQYLGPAWQVDHIIPLNRGGLHHPDNLQIVLKIFNLQKHDSLESEFRPPLPFEVWNI